MSTDYANGRQAGWNRAETTLEGRYSNHAINHPIPATASPDFIQGYSDGVELSNSGFTVEGVRDPLLG